MNFKQLFPRKKNSSWKSSTQFAAPLLVSAFVGVITGFVVVGFVHVIDFTEHHFFSTGKSLFSGLGIFSVILIPVIGGLLVGPIVTFFAPEAKGHGVPEVMKAIAVNKGKIRPRVVLAKAIASAIAIGSGASVGREGPIVQIGSALGSFVSRAFKMTHLKVKNFVACGAAAGIAGVFNTPIAGVMFAMEVILRDFGAKALSTVVVAAVSASIISQIYLGDNPAFEVPIYSLVHPLEIFFYVLLGVFSAFAAQLFISVLHYSENVWDRWGIQDWLKPAIGGLFVGFIGVMTPQIFGSGLHTIGEALRGQLPFALLLSLVFLKIIATSLSLGSGSSGGVFAPALFIGAVLGGAFGILISHLSPFNIGPNGAYALVGMASVFAAAAHAPVTAILIVFEMTGDYKMILPLMIATVVSVATSQRLRKESIYTIKLIEKGIDFEAMQGTAFLGSMQVKDIMTPNFSLVKRETSAQELVEKMTTEKEKSFYVENSSGNLVGVLHRNDIQAAYMETELPIFVADDLAYPIGDLCHDDDLVSDVAKLMDTHHVSEIPVMDAHNPQKMIGLLKSEDIFHAVTLAGEKRDAMSSRVEPQGGDARGAIQIRFLVDPKSPIANSQLKDLDIPDEVIFISIQRRGKSIIPEGNITIKPQDKVWALAMGESEHVFRGWLIDNNLEVLDTFKL